MVDKRGCLTVDEKNDLVVNERECLAVDEKNDLVVDEGDDPVHDGRGMV